MCGCVGVRACSDYNCKNCRGVLLTMIMNDGQGHRSNHFINFELSQIPAVGRLIEAVEEMLEAHKLNSLGATTQKFPYVWL